MTNNLVREWKLNSTLREGAFATSGTWFVKFGNINQLEDQENNERRS